MQSSDFKVRALQLDNYLCYKFPHNNGGFIVINSITLHLKLKKADIELKTLITPFYDARESLGGKNIHNRRTYIEIKGAVSDFIQGKDLIIFSPNKIIDEEFNIYSPDVAKDIIIRICMVEENSVDLYKEPTVSIHDGELYVDNLYFSVEQFNQIKTIIYDDFIKIFLNLSRRLSKEEITENLEKNEGFIPYYYDYEDIEYEHKTLVFDGESKNILRISDNHNGYGVKITNFTIGSSRPKYIDKIHWVDSIFSIEERIDKEDRSATYNQGIDLKHQTIKEFKKLHSLVIGVIILLVILVFKI
ncbi:hypothetical protein [Acinetobacter baumannii]|uniref:hypothetical protein n=1 Tax=Acinetobacter baumannii TaxID=470 RepID=UPI001126F881|nr:hypothetical protein [Acinetobacter baumannii]TPU58106.1 hypothetical protein FJV29_07125 [Acinetobacter baumannii]